MTSFAKSQTQQKKIVKVFDDLLIIDQSISNDGHLLGLSKQFSFADCEKVEMIVIQF